MLGPAKPRALGSPISVSLDALIPRDHFYRHLDATLDLGFVRDWVKDAYPDRGRPSIDPIVFFKRSLVMFFEGIRSERQLLTLAADRLSVRWRLGYGLMPVELANEVSRLMVNSVSCTASMVQRAGLEALAGPQDDARAMVEAFRRRRDLMVEGLNRIPGISCLNPAGAFYVFPNITGTGIGSKEFADRLLEEFGVAALSGASFGAHGEGYLRLSYANSEENLRKALDRIEAAALATVAAR